MNTISCPSCGAPVAFRSAASVMAVCRYCNSTLIKDAESVRNIGRMADVIEDYSPIQINTSGTIDGRGFTVVGRIQLRYDAGFWNEWYVLDDAGEPAWLSDASGQYTFTRAVDASEGKTLAGGRPLPRFADLRAGARLDLGRAPDGSAAVFVAGDVRTAQCTGGQGELPFTVGAGYTARVADFRRGGEFLTLDYSDDGSVVGALAAGPMAGSSPVADSADGPPAVADAAPSPSLDEALAALSALSRPADLRTLSPGPARTAAAGVVPDTPTIYRGVAVTLAALKPQLLRDPETIRDAAGRVKGKVANLECPSCGASIAFSPGATTHLLCQTCHASLDTAGPVAEVIDAARRVEAVPSTLPLGAKGTIAATDYTVIGMMRRVEVSEEVDGAAGEWTEYLLYAPQRGFLWLVETDEGWERSDVLDTWPFWYTADQALLDGQTYDKLYDYDAVVKYAAGAFNWRVEVGDVGQITDFQAGAAKLSAESSDSELTWSRSTPVSGSDLAAWFGKQVDVAALSSGPPSLSDRPAGGYRQVAKWLTILLLAVNAIPILFSPGRALVIVILATVGLYFPAWLMDLAALKKAK